MPIVFAIRNPSLTTQLHAPLEYGVYPLEYYNEPYPWRPHDHFQDGVHISYYGLFFRFTFAIREDGIVPNLTAISSNEDCTHKLWGIFKPIQEVLTVPFPLSDEGVSECAQLNASGPVPTPTNCQSGLSHKVESSILAEITHTECRSATPAVSCPTEEPTKKSVATGHDHTQAAWLAITLAFTLAFYAVVY
ncbi:hypothetical protein N7475_006607 [Penicillium sp. IBT 31633x]|nr:hypothetical protein N7475_006607 [Penicillium sp. IBT 31633x]